MHAELLVFADPMCSWCWGFSPVISNIGKRYGDELPLRVIMGGLFAGSQSPMDQQSKDTISEHWRHVVEASGQPFNFDFFDRDGFVYNTEPSCRAVVTARVLTEEDQALRFLAALHAAFYRDNRDITASATLADIAEGLEFDRVQFIETFESREMVEATRQDFALARRSGVRGFPTLIGRRGDHLDLLSPGYQSWDRIESLLDIWIADGGEQRRA